MPSRRPAGAWPRCLRESHKNQHGVPDGEECERKPTSPLVVPVRYGRPGAFCVYLSGDQHTFNDLAEPTTFDRILGTLAVGSQCERRRANARRSPKWDAPRLDQAQR